MQKATPSTHSNGAEIADLVLLAAIQKNLDVEIISSDFMHRHWTENLDLSDEDAVAATLGVKRTAIMGHAVVVAMAHVLAVLHAPKFLADTVTS